MGQLGSDIDAAARARLAAAARAADRRWLDFEPEQMAAAFNRKPFLLHHRLGEHPLFSRDAVFALCRRMPPANVHVRVGRIPVDAEFDHSLARHNGGITLEAALDDFEGHGAYIAIYNPERDAEYRPAIEALLGEVVQATEALEPGLNWYSTYIFISAHGAVTPYHMDREMNFLLQVQGTKTVQLWTPYDDAVMTPVERDRLLAVRGAPRPAWRPELDALAQTFELSPGLGVHHPFIAPHLVTTGPAFSISLAITFRTVQSDGRTDAHVLNHRLRELGLRPAVVGRSVAVDHAKASLVRAARRLRDAGRALGPKGGA